MTDHIGTIRSALNVLARIGTATNDENVIVLAREAGFALDHLAERIDPDALIIRWTVGDIVDYARENGITLTREQAIEVLDDLDANLDASVGVNWDVIDMAIREYCYLNKITIPLDDLEDDDDDDYEGDDWELESERRASAISNVDYDWIANAYGSDQE